MSCPSTLDWVIAAGLHRAPSLIIDVFRSIYGKARRWTGLDAVAPGADEENEASVHGSTVRHDRSQGSVSWRCSASDIQPCQLRKTAGCSGTCLGSLEFHRGL